MIVLSHRGFWRTPEEKNARDAFTRTVRERFGTETDVRDRDGRLVVAHDPADGSALDWGEVVAMFEGTGLPLAVNVKADGLSGLLAQAFDSRGIDWFAFDMSVPETVRYARANLPYFTRHSDVEPAPVLYDQAQGVWLDAFASEWFDEATIRDHLAHDKRVCVVSPELHGRPHQDTWAMLKPFAERGAAVMLCTDWPDQAKAFFNS